MNAKHDHNTRKPTMAVDDVFVTTLLPARRWIASTVAVVMTSLTLALVSLPGPVLEVTHINGLHVTNLPAVLVSPSADELKAAHAMGQATLGAVAAPAASQAAQLGAKLAMPYYSFAATSSKE